MKNFILSFKDIKPNKDLAFSNIPRSNSQYLTHGYHRYPAKFIPDLARHLINKNTKTGELVCDPFGGCGTSILEAKINGRPSIGIDINPLAALISKTKTTPVQPKKLNDATFQLKALIHSRKDRVVPKFKYDKDIRYWFTDENMIILNRIYRSIGEINDPEIKRFFLCAFSHILKNSSKWLMKSIKPTIDKDKKDRDPIVEFYRHLNFMTKKNEEYISKLEERNNLNTLAKIYLRDARDTKLKENSVDYILTSPPYVTSYEYADLHQLSLIWLEAIGDTNWIDFKKSFIGTSHRRNKNKDIHSKLGISIIDDLMYNDTVLSSNVRTYFEDMADFLKEAKRILKKGKKMTLVIGNTSLKNVDILNAEVAYEQMRYLGFRDIMVEKRATSFSSITPFRDSKSGKFTSINNPNKKRAYEFEYILNATA